MAAEDGGSVEGGTITVGLGVDPSALRAGFQTAVGIARGGAAEIATAARGTTVFDAAAIAGSARTSSTAIAGVTASVRALAAASAATRGGPGPLAGHASAAATARGEVARLAADYTAMGSRGVAAERAIETAAERTTAALRAEAEAARRIASAPPVAAAARTASAPLGPILGPAFPTAERDFRAASAAAAAREAAAERASRTIREVITNTERLGRETTDTGVRSVAAFRRSADAAAAYLVKLGATDAQIDRIGASIAELEGRATRAAGSMGRLGGSVGGFSAQGQRVANASVGVAFALEGLARGGDAADSGIRQALRAAAAVGPAFGVQGLLVSGVAASTAALLDLNRTATASAAVLERLNGITDLRQATGEVERLNSALSKTVAERERLRDGQRSASETFVGSLGPLNPALELYDRFLGSKKNLEQAGADAQAARSRQAAIGIADAERTAEQSRALSLRATETYHARLAAGDQQRLAREAQAFAAGRTSLQAYTGERVRIAQAGAAREVEALRQQQAALRAPVGRFNEAAPDAARRLVEASLIDNQIAAVRSRAAAETVSAQADVRRAYQDTAHAVIATFRGLRVGQGEVTGLVEQYQTSLARATAELRAQVDPWSAQARAARELVEQLKQVVPVDLVIKIPTVPDLARPLHAAFERATRDGALRDSAKRGLTDAPSIITVPREVRARLGPAFEQVGDQVDTTTTRVDRLSARLVAVGGATRGILDVADAIGIVGDSTRRGIAGAGGLVAAVGQLRQLREAQRAATAANDGTAATGVLASLGGIARVAGPIGSAIGAAFQVAASVSALFGKSDADREREAALRENSRHLAELRLSFSGFNPRSPSSALDAARLTERYIQLLPRAGGVNAFNAAVRETGVDRAQLLAVAREYGFNIQDKAGRLDPALVREFNSAIREAAVMASRFGSSFADVSTRIDARSRIYDLDRDPKQSYRDAIQVTRETSPALYERYYGGIDIDAAGGRAAAEAASRALFDDLTNNRIRIEDFGTADRDQLLSTILRVDSALDLLDESARSAAGAMSNIPTGFKASMDYRRYLSADAVSAPPRSTAAADARAAAGLSPADAALFAQRMSGVLSTLVVPGAPPAGPVDLSHYGSQLYTPPAGGLGATPRDTMPPADGDMQFTGPVTVVVQSPTGESDEQLAARVQRALQTRAYQLTGNSRRVVDALQSS